MSVTIQIRRDTAAAWSSVNPVLASGELGLETDTDKIKLGNGVSAWSSLPYLVSPTMYQLALQSGASIKTINGESVLGAGNIVVGANGGGVVGSSKVALSAVSLGAQSASQSSFTYYSVTNVASRGLVSRMRISASASAAFDVEVRGAANGSAELFLQALDVDTDYDISIPWYYEATSGNAMHIGIRNRAADSRSFTLNSLRLERFA